MSAINGIGALAGLSAVTGPTAAAATAASTSRAIDPTLGAGGAAGATGMSIGDAGATSGQPFADALGNALEQLNAQLVSADASMADFAAGGSSDLHTVMLQMQEASIGLRVGIQVRDRLLEAYQEIMRLQL